MSSSAEEGDGEPASDTPPARLLDLTNQLHSELHLALALFEDGHYDDAVRKASQRFINRVQELVDRPDLDGAGLIEKTFSSQSPLLAFNNRSTPLERDEHDGYRFLVAGLARALRNVVTHHDNYGFGATAAWEWLVFTSAMHRRLDQAQQVTTESQPTATGEDSAH